MPKEKRIREPILADRILGYFEERQYKIITYKELYEAIWKVPAYPGYKNTVFATINKARSLLVANCFIHNISKVGYIYVEEGTNEVMLAVDSQMDTVENPSE